MIGATAAGMIKVDAHHAIIPTARASKVNLTTDEGKVYRLVAQQYLMQFCPDAQFRKCVIELDIAGGKLLPRHAFGRGGMADLTGQ